MIGIRDVLRTDDGLRRVGAYMTVGLLGTIVDVGLFTALRVALGVPALPANSASYSAGIVNNYVLHRRWTYGGRSRKTVRIQFAQFAAISLSAMAVNNLLVLLLAAPMGRVMEGPAHGDLLAKVCATALGMCWNYVANNFWTFGDVKAK